MHQAVQAGYCVYSPSGDGCQGYFDPVFGPICVNNPVDPIPLTICVPEIT
jgi:hypothetical protein